MWQKGEAVVFVGHSSKPEGKTEAAFGLRVGQKCEVVDSLGPGHCSLCGPSFGVRVTGATYPDRSFDGVFGIILGHCWKQFRKPLDFSDLMKVTEKEKEPELV